MFGARNTVPVVLLEPVEPLRALHLATLAWLEERGVEFRPDRHSGAAYRPHATVRGSAVDPGALELTELALIDRAPDRRRLRRVVAIAPLRPDAAASRFRADVRRAKAAWRRGRGQDSGTQSPVARYWTFFAMETAWSAKRSW